MNAVLLVLLVMIAGFAGCAWVSPDCLDRIAVYCRARAAALRASRAAYRAAFDEVMRDAA